MCPIGTLTKNFNKKLKEEENKVLIRPQLFEIYIGLPKIAI